MWKRRNVWNLPVKLNNLVSDLKYSQYSGKLITKKRKGKKETEENEIVR